MVDRRRGRIIIVDDTVVVKGAKGSDCRQGGPLFVGGEPRRKKDGIDVARHFDDVIEAVLRTLPCLLLSISGPYLCN